MSQHDTLTPEQLDAHLDAILKAAGSALRHYTTQKPLDDMRAALRAALATHPAQAQQPPYAWAVSGLTNLFTGPTAEYDARQEAKHCGGTAEAFPLFRDAQAQQSERRTVKVRVAQYPLTGEFLAVGAPAQAQQSEPYAETWFAVLDALDELHGREWRHRCETLHESVLATLKTKAQQAGEPSDEEIAELHDSMFPAPYDGHANVIKFSRALMAMHATPVPAQPVQGVPDWRDEVQRLAMVASTAMHQSARDQRNILEDIADRLSALTASPTPPAQQGEKT